MRDDTEGPFTTRRRIAGIGALLLGILVGSVALAQQPRRGDRGPGPGGPRIDMDRLVEFLGLSDDQKEAWQAAHEAHRESISGVMEQLRDNHQALEDAIDAEDALRVGELTLEGRRLQKQVEESFEGLQTQLASILTEEQQERFEAFKAARGGDGPGFGQRRHRRGPGPGRGGNV